MPQMHPISWLSLFLLFSMIFIMFNMMNYYSTLHIAPKLSKINNKSIISMNWKW